MEEVIIALVAIIASRLTLFHLEIDAVVCIYAGTIGVKATSMHTTAWSKIQHCNCMGLWCRDAPLLYQNLVLLATHYHKSSFTTTLSSMPVFVHTFDNPRISVVLAIASWSEVRSLQKCW